METINYDSPAYKLAELGFNSLSDIETLSLITGVNATDKIRMLLKEVNNNLRELAKLSLKDMERLGLTKRESQAIGAALEIGRRKQLSEATEVKQVRCSKDVADIFQPLLCDLDHEEFWIIYMNRSNKIMKYDKLSQGGISGTVTDVRIVMKRAINLMASGIIVAHNHPSGNLNPSESDTAITRKIKEAGQLLDVQLLDHIIIAEKEYYSFADNGII